MNTTDDDRDDSVLRGVGAAPPLLPSLPMPTGQVIGRYRVLRLLGRGGMGAVYEAVDIELGRHVAMKFGNVRLCDHSVALSRFRRERSITAELEHPNIIPVYDVGTAPTGEPYYVMRIARGEPMDRRISEAATLEARLALIPNVIAVADAIAYAHSRGVVHRDVKPHNVLIGTFGETLVADWGLAKDLQQPVDDASDHRHSAMHADTHTGDVVGTPAYMAPEQASGGPVDARTDVFALGAMLFHLIAQRPPVAGHDDVTAAIAAVGVPSDLAAIAAKALQLDPAKRYQQSDEFAGDLRRFLAGNIVWARSYTRTELLQRWVQRHRRELFIGLLLGALFIVFAIGSTIRIVHERDRADEDRVRAEVSRAEAMHERVRAEHRFNDVRKLATRFLFEFHDAIATVPGATRARELVVTTAKDSLERLAGDTGQGDASLRHELASAYERLSRIQDASGGPSREDHQAARTSMVKAVALREQIAASNPDDLGAARELATALRSLSSTQQGPESLASVTRALHIMKRLVARATGDRSVSNDLASVELVLGLALAARGDLAATIEHEKNAVAIWERLSAEAPTEPKIRRNLALGYKYLAGASEVQASPGSPTEHDHLDVADQLASKAVAIDETRVIAEPSNAEAQLDLSYSYGQLAHVRMRLGELDGALSTSRKALSLREKIAAADPADTAAKTAVARAQHRVGQVLLLAGRPAEAMEWSSKAAAYFKAQWLRDPHDAWSRSGLAEAYTGVGKAAARVASSTTLSPVSRRAHLRAACDCWRKSRELVEALRDDKQRVPDAEVVAWLAIPVAACAPP